MFRQAFGHYPRSYANHGSNRDNVYWSEIRFRSRILRHLYAWRVTRGTYYSEGHAPESPYFWGDLCREHIEYVRGFSFPAINLFSVHRNVLYRDPATEFVKFWFLAPHASDAPAFNALLHPANREKLVRDGGVCIVATHAGRGFVENGNVNRQTRRLLEPLAEKDGCFVPVSSLLDYLRTQGFESANSLGTTATARVAMAAARNASGERA